MQNYKDRGIIKWQPFDALVGHSDLILQYKKELLKINKPELSYDQYEIFDRVIKEAIEKNEVIYVDYYHNGFIYETFGSIKKIDLIHRILILKSREQIGLDMIIDLYVN